MPNKVSPEQRAHIKVLSDQGLRAPEIATQIGLSTQVVAGIIAWLKHRDSWGSGKNHDPAKDRHRSNIDEIHRRAETAVHNTYAEEVEVDEWPTDPSKFLEFIDEFISLSLRDYQDLSTIEDAQRLSQTVAIAIEAYLNAFGERVVADSKMKNG
jgi:hypothetical protein